MDRTATWWQKTAVVLKNKNINILHYKVFSRVEEICAAFKQRLLDEKKKTSAISFYEQMSVAIFTLHLRRKKKTPARLLRHNTPVWPIVACDDWHSKDHGFYELNHMLGPLIIRRAPCDLNLGPFGGVVVKHTPGPKPLATARYHLFYEKTQVRPWALSGSFAIKVG